MTKSDRPASTALQMMETAWALRSAALAGPAGDVDKRLDEVRTRLVSAVELLRGEEEPVLLAHALHLCAHVEADLGHRARARELWEESIALLRTADDPLQLAHKVRHLGDLLRTDGALEDARSLLEEAVALHREHGEATGRNPNATLDLANALRRLALLSEQRTEPEAAREQWREARALYAQLGLAAGVDEAARHLRELAGEGATDD